MNCPGEPRCQHTEGRLPADNKTYTVDLTLTGLEPGATYHFAIEAENSAGGAFQNGEFTVQEIPPGSAPNGSKVTEPYSPPELPWTNQSGDEGAARTVAEQHAKEYEEQRARNEATAAAGAEAAIKGAQQNRHSKPKQKPPRVGAKKPSTPPASFPR